MTRFLSICLAMVAARAVSAADSPVDFNRDIRPLLANSCYACHGPDESQRKGKLRLDLREEAIKRAIVPGQAAASALVERLTSTDADEAMPPPRSKKPALTPEQVALVKRWIDEGAKFDEHWAYIKPKRAPVPAVGKPKEIRDPIDAFIAAGWAKNGLRASPEADRVTLLRRLSFDLTGLPPTIAEVDAFLTEKSLDAAYERAVDRLLASPAFGERMAVMWLDVVRYADTGGYHSDNHRDVWLFRDYVINSFNANKPFDQFTIEQIAGDLLPNPTSETRIASGYNRMLMTTEEGGAQPKEYTAKYAADRVRNTSNAWLGATLGCAECHNHKYDPYTTKDFYRFAAFFADVKEKAVGRQDQTPIMLPDQEKELARLEKEVARLEADLCEPSPSLDAAQASWEERLGTGKDALKGLPKPVADALAVDAMKRSDSQKRIVLIHYRSRVAPEAKEFAKDYLATLAQRDQLNKSAPSTLISMTGAPRPIRVLPRGNWLDDSGELVAPDVPAFLGGATPMNAKARASRLDLARWFVAPENPLTARVFVNRLWKIAFGQGLVRNMDDFGLQGTLPTHPELLDWLALDFIENGWNTKETLKKMVMSSAYRQSSHASKEARERDPANAGLARQNRFRLDAEFVRDNALAVSGLLVAKVGGPSVKPYQPAGFWSYLNFPKREWQADRGDNQYRRGLYTYWCRSFLHPSLFAFDAPTREECSNERSRSSTPLQALVLLNDPTYVEASRALARQIISETGGDPAKGVAYAFKRTLSRVPSSRESTVLTALYAKHLKEYQGDAAGAKQWLAIGDAPAPADADPAKLAAWTSVARVMLNLHEAIHRN